MKQALVHNQTPIDFCLQHTGQLLEVVKFAFANNISLTDENLVGQELTVDGLATDGVMLEFFEDKKVIVATAPQKFNDDIFELPLDFPVNN